VKREKLIPVICEICGENNKAVLHKHHIVERVESDTSNHEYNLAVVCSNCHNKVHDKQIIILGILPSTKLPYKRTLVYETGGRCNVPGVIDFPFKSKAESMKLFIK